MSGRFASARARPLVAPPDLAPGGAIFCHKELAMSAELPAAGQPVKVWDGFIRLFHWSLVAIVALNLFVLEEGDVAHRWLGYFAAGAVLASMRRDSLRASSTSYPPSTPRAACRLRCMAWFSFSAKASLASSS